MQIRTLMAVILAASLGAVVSGCQRNDDGTTQPQSRIDSSMMQGTAPGAPTQGSNRSPTAGKQQEGDSSSAGAKAQPPNRDAAIASPSDEGSKSDEASKQKGSS